jgi:hypothetical protein
MATQALFFLVFCCCHPDKTYRKGFEHTKKIAIPTPEFYETKETNSYRFFS